MWKNTERRQFCAASPALVEPYSKLSLSLVSVSFQRNPRPSKIGCSVSMKTMARDSSRPSARQRSQKPRMRSFSDKPVRPWLTSQFIRRKRGSRSIRHYAAQQRAAKGRRGFLGLLPRDDLAIFLDETLWRMLEQIEHGFRRPAQPRSLHRHHDRPVDQDGMRQHE